MARVATLEDHLVLVSNANQDASMQVPQAEVPWLTDISIGCNCRVEKVGERPRPRHSRLSRVTPLADPVLQLHGQHTEVFWTDWKRLILKYEISSGTAVTECLKAALVQREVKQTHGHLEPSRADSTRTRWSERRFVTFCSRGHHWQLLHTQWNSEPSVKAKASVRRAKASANATMTRPTAKRDRSKPDANAQHKKARGIPCKELQCFHGGKRGPWKRDCRQRGRDQESGQEELTEDAQLCEA